MNILKYKREILYLVLIFIFVSFGVWSLNTISSLKDKIDNLTADYIVQTEVIEKSKVTEKSLNKEIDNLNSKLEKQRIDIGSYKVFSDQALKIIDLTADVVDSYGNLVDTASLFSDGYTNWNYVVSSLQHDFKTHCDKIQLLYDESNSLEVTSRVLP